MSDLLITKKKLYCNSRPHPNGEFTPQQNACRHQQKTFGNSALALAKRCPENGKESTESVQRDSQRVKVMIESALLPKHQGQIDGEWVPAKSGETFPVFNPSTGEHLADVPRMGAAETDMAISAACNAMRTQVPLEMRAQWLRRISELMLDHKQELGRIITLEHGKPLKEGIVEVEYAAGFFSFFSKQLDKLKHQELPGEIRGAHWEVHFRPTGVVGSITPWNFPQAMMAKKLAPALGAGCAIVAKPASMTPLSAIAFCEIARQAGLPAGMINLVIGSAEPISETMCQHPAVRLISFTGSTEVGKLLAASTAPHVKRLALELGGNAPFIVFEDADLESAADALMANKFRGSGQTCVCTNRVYAHAQIMESFVNLVAQRVRNLSVGDGMDPETDIGPLIDRAGFDKVAEHVADALSHGAKRLVGDDPPRPADNWGCFYPPTLLVGAQPEMKVCREETFGPVLAISQFEQAETVLAAANDTEYGLAAYVFTKDLARAKQCAAALSFGHVGLNTGSGPAPEAPFGGMKQSGYGREGGLEGLLEFCEPQTIVVG
jgi:succinate-semialdehyde dehydrogenase/glutarate-semialdehyde dehydrogenase